MKYILSILLVVCFSFCKGQNITYLSGYADVYKMDTTFVLMQVCDTSRSSRMYIFSMYGYNVREVLNIPDVKKFISYYGNGEQIQMFQEYLTADKKPLPKNIIVWQSIEVEK